ncbi:uncharacterized protein BcabD6B2_20140 [Babesia caballi]|uniref:Uncharacterized protein n=1 Tax=Babesia caballi TaxID=5871 RepID=A0AAV4LVJ5_BABCB|nr:hypothetical protein BcabD6B2_20140 [Babesia caballi]
MPGGRQSRNPEGGQGSAHWTAATAPSLRLEALLELDVLLLQLGVLPLQVLEGLLQLSQLLLQRLRGRVRPIAARLGLVRRDWRLRAVARRTAMLAMAVAVAVLLPLARPVLAHAHHELAIVVVVLLVVDGAQEAEAQLVDALARGLAAVEGGVVVARLALGGLPVRLQQVVAAVALGRRAPGGPLVANAAELGVAVVRGPVGGAGHAELAPVYLRGLGAELVVHEGYLAVAALQGREALGAVGTNLDVARLPPPALALQTETALLELRDLVPDRPALRLCVIGRAGLVPGDLDAGPELLPGAHRCEGGLGRSIGVSQDPRVAKPRVAGRRDAPSIYMR